MNSLSVGDIISARVENVSSYGVEIKYGNQKGFIQIPELSWDTYGLQGRVSSLCEVGDAIEVRILNITQEQFYASAREVSPELDPWHASNKLVVGHECQGMIVLAADYGYLVKLPNFAISLLPLESSNDMYTEGQVVDVRVSSIDLVDKKIIVSLTSEGQ